MAEAKLKRFKPTKEHLFSEKTLVWIVGFAIIGAAAIIISHAATPSATVEPEEGSVAGNAAVIADSSASGGLAIKFQSPSSGTIILPNPGSWTNITGNIANMASECGNLTGIWAVPGSGSVIAGIAQKGLWINSGGTNWSRLGTGSGSDSITNRPGNISFDPVHTGTWYEAGIYNGGGVYKTTDSGQTWKQLGNISHTDFVSVDYTDPNRQTLIAGRHEGAQEVWLSKNGGQTWTNIGANLPSGTGFSSDPVVVNSTTYVVNTAPSWGGGSAGIYRTTNSGTSWTRVSSIATQEAPPLVTSGGAIYYLAGQWSSDHLARSTDGGQTWTEVGSGLSSVTPIELHDGRLVSASSSRLMVSNNSGSSWTAFGATLPYSPAAIAYASSSGAFYINHWDCGNIVLPDAVQRLL